MPLSASSLNENNFAPVRKAVATTRPSVETLTAAFTPSNENRCGVENTGELCRVCQIYKY